MPNDNIVAASDIIRSIREPRRTALAAHLVVACSRLESWQRTLAAGKAVRDLPIHADAIIRWASKHQQGVRA